VARHGFLVGPAYDGFFFVGAPVVAVALGALVARGSGDVVSEYGFDATVQALALRTLIHAHLVIVFARSHLNPAVFARFPRRFVVAPVVLTTALLLSTTLQAIAMAVVIAWDVVHSSLQTFGLARLYERRVHHDPAHGRNVDLALCHALYIGTFLAGPLYGLVVHTALGPLVAVAPTCGPAVAAIAAAAPGVRVVALVASAVALGAWGVHELRARRRRTPRSAPKLALLGTTALACVVGWGLDTFGQALFIVNVFHAVQYFGLVAHRERASLAQRLGLPTRHGTAFVLVTLALVGGLYGFWFGAAANLWLPAGAARTAVLVVVNVVALLHFWYDGFLWRVRDEVPPASTVVVT
jgi:hypothetical protein